jgi:protein-tyrosine phosphatase
MDWFSKRDDGEQRHGRDRRPTVTEVSARLLVGEYPRVEDVSWLKQAFGVTAVHNLQDEEDLIHHGLDIDELREAYERHGMRLVRTPISDGSADHMAHCLAAALEDLRALIESGERVYLHCNGGLNRAPTLAIAYLRAHEGMSLDEAAAHLKRRRACGPFMTVLEDYFGPRDHKPER